MRIINLAFGVLLTLSATEAKANYRQLLNDGASRDEVAELYAEYAETVLREPKGGLGEIARLAGGEDFQQSFMLACLSNGWMVRAIDVESRYLPPAGVWGYTEPNFGGMLRQFPADCQSIDAINVVDMGDFDCRSIRIGRSVQVQVFAEPNFGGKPTLVRESRELGRVMPRSLKIRTRPRIDYVTLSEYAADQGNASFRLHVSGANIDDGAVIVIDNVDAAKSIIETRLDNSTWLGLGTDVANAGYALDPTYFAFPIYHYDSIVSPQRNLVFGREIKIVVRNRDGQISNQLSFTIPKPSELDSDGDGLLDEWENNGFNGLDLPAMGANPHRKDAYVEVDHMIVSGRVWSDFSETSYPQTTIFEQVEKMFARAPILNPDGSPGIALHIDYGQDSFGAGNAKGGTIVPWKRYIGFGDNDAAKKMYCDLKMLRRDPSYFDENRKKVFGYCVFADQLWGKRSTGLSDSKTAFTVSLGICRMRAIDHDYQIGVFTHELGHTMGLSHNGGQGGNSKPNFNSLMNYLFTFPGHDIDGKLGSIEGELSGDHVYAYSEGMRADLNEGALYEVLGVANHYPHDWNGNGKIDAEPVSKKLCSGKSDSRQILKDNPDWAMLKFPVGWSRSK